MWRWVGRALLSAMLTSAPLLAQAGVEATIDEAMKIASSGNLRRAEAVLTELEKTQPDHAEIQYRLGLVLLRLNQVAPAGEHLEKAARLAPRSALIWLGVAQTRLRLGRRDDAVAAAETALTLAPKEPGVARALAMFFEQAGDYAKAAEQQMRWVDASRGDQQAMARAAELYLRAGQPDKTISLAARILAGGDSAAIRHLLGQAYGAQGEPARAAEEMQKAIRLDPNEPSYYAGLAQLLIDHRTPQPAVVALEEGLRQVPNQPELLRLLGVAYYGTGDAAKALDAFLKLTALEPDSEVGYASLETLLPEAGSRMPEIIEHLRGFRERQPASPVGYFLGARALQIASPEKTAEIRALLENAIRAEPKFWPAYFELHKLLLEDEETQGAARALEKTVELNPGYAPAHYSLAQVYARLGDRARAREQREIHHTLATREREESEQRRQQAPRLSYDIVDR